MTETIVAVATPPGRGGVGIVRLSGSCAYNIALKITHQASFTPRIASFSFIYQDEEPLDQGLILYFNAPFSFTGEDVIEFQCHGSPVVLDCLLQECIKCGARLAKPGEFSERAFLNDKIDLTQAEAIADLIHAHSQTAARLAIRSLQGDFSQRIHQLNEHIIQLRLYVEAAIDFPEEEIDFLNNGHITQQLDLIIQHIQHIRAEAYQGSMLREGLHVVIAGHPNVGKSTLINCLASRDVAIVTDVAGTTRDVLKEQMMLDDLPLHIIDTAGLRETIDVVEQEGIKRTWKEVAQADCVLWMMDVSSPHEQDPMHDQMTALLPSSVPILRIYNKIDQHPDHLIQEDGVYISAKYNQGITTLKEKMKQAVGFQPQEGLFLARRRHLQALDAAYQLLLNGQQQVCFHRAFELLAEDLRLAHQSLCEITGQFTSDDLLGVIFSSFCIGK